MGERASSIPCIEVAIGDNVGALVFRTLTQLSREDEDQLTFFGDKHKVQIYLQPGGPERCGRTHTHTHAQTHTQTHTLQTNYTKAHNNKYTYAMDDSLTPQSDAPPLGVGPHEASGLHSRAFLQPLPSCTHTHTHTRTHSPSHPFPTIVLIGRAIMS